MRLVFLSLLFFSFSANAVLPIFKIGDRVLVRGANGVVVSQPSIDSMVSKIGTGAGNVTASGTQSFTVGGKSAAVGVSKNIDGAALATTVASALLSKNALGLVATLSLPYVIDSLTGEVQHQTTSPQTPATTTAPINANSMTCQNPVKTISAFNQCVPAGNYYVSTYLQSACSATSCPYRNLVRRTSDNYQISVAITFPLGSVCPSGAIWNTTQVACVLTTPTCTAPSVYDSATGMCTGSAINEPANAQQLAQDVQDTFNNSPQVAPLTAIDTLLDNDVDVPSGSPSITDTPEPITGEKTTDVQHGFDPATSHPTTTTTEKQDTVQFSPDPSSPNTLDAKKQTTTTTTTVDDLTGQVISTNTSTETTTPGEAQTNEQQTDCDKYPESIGCSEYGEVTEPENIPTVDVGINFSPSSLGSGSCPAPQTMNLHFVGAVQLSYQPVCDFASAVRPFFLAFAYLAAGMLVIGEVRA